MAASAKLRRLKRRSEFLAARNGKTERRKSLVVQAIRRKAPEGDWIGEGYTATKKIGHSPARSRAKRRLREAARLLLPDHGVPGADYVFIARGVTGRTDWSHLLDDMKSALISLAPALDASCNPS